MIGKNNLINRIQKRNSAMKSVLLSLFLLLPSHSTAAMYKCIIDGETVFSQRQCPDSSEETKLNIFTTTQSNPSSDPLRKGEREMLKNYHNRTAKRGEINIGMTEKQLKRSLGKPTSVNRTNSSYDGKTEQWVFRKKGKSTQYVYFKDGKVIGWN
jgi:hypothetical protein